MSIVTEIFIICDGHNASPDCHENFGVDNRSMYTGTTQRRKAKGEGWEYIDGKDICPACALAFKLNPALKQQP